MEIKRYRAYSIKDATAMVKDTLGPEAMIVATRKLGGEGEGNLFEVAAVPPGAIGSRRKSSPFGEVQAELMSIKEMIYLLNHSNGIIEKLMMSTPLMNLYTRLLRNGVNDYYAKLFLERAGALNGNSPDGLNNIRGKVIKEMGRVIQVKDIFEKRNKHKIIAAFIGTTGVGKTTTIAKLAARLMLRAQRRVGLISIDNYRVGAMEQLKTYANILGIPCFPAFERQDLFVALRRMEDRDVILIDTAGQSQYDRTKMEELKGMMPEDLSISSHLLLSVSTNETDMARTAENFSPLKFESYIFTKLDEAEKYGSLMNQVMKSNLPVSYITNGQNVPEDIQEADKSKILRLLLSNN